MRVLVTGASSLLLGGVARQLAARGDHVVCLQRGAARLGEPFRAGEPHDPDDADLRGMAVDEVRADVRDAEAVARAARGCDAIVHGAAKVGVTGTWEDYRSVNVDGTANVLAAARRAGIERIVHVSSPSVAHAGRPVVGAGAEPALGGPRSAWYARSKALAERLALGATDDGLGVVVLRPHLVWGPGDTQLVGRIVARARAGQLALVGGGTALVDSTFVDNAVSAHVAALDAVSPAARCSGRAYVIANGEPRPIRDLVAGICRAAGVPFAPRDVPLGVARPLGALVERVWPRIARVDGSGGRRDDPEPPLTRFLAEQLGTAHWFDPRPARADLGWSPHVGLDAGLERLARWFGDRDRPAHG